MVTCDPERKSCNHNNKQRQTFVPVSCTNFSKMAFMTWRTMNTVPVSLFFSRWCLACFQLWTKKKSIQTAVMYTHTHKSVIKKGVRTEQLKMKWKLFPWVWTCFSFQNKNDISYHHATNPTWRLSPKSILAHVTGENTFTLFHSHLEQEPFFVFILQ